MNEIHFEKILTKFELTNQCIILEDNDGHSFSGAFAGANEKLLVRSGGDEFDAILREFYVNNKFKLGLYFSHEEGHVSDFFFNRSITEGKRIKLKLNKEEGAVDGKTPVEIEVFIVTRHQ